MIIGGILLRIFAILYVFTVFVDSLRFSCPVFLYIFLVVCMVIFLKNKVSYHINFATCFKLF